MRYLAGVRVVEREKSKRERELTKEIERERSDAFIILGCLLS